MLAIAPAQIDGGSEVMIELKLYAVDKTNQRNIGTQLPQQVGLYNVNAVAQNLVNSNQSLVNQAIAQGLIPAGSSNITIALALIASGLVQSTLLSNTVGFFGGYTTFSSFGWETAKMLEDGEWLRATTYIAASVVAGLLLSVAGIRLANKF